MKRLFPLLAFVALSFALYHQALFAGFVYDDQWYVVTNAALEKFDFLSYWTDPRTVANPSSGLATDVYRPMTTTSFAIDRALWGLRPAPYHAENIFLHGLNAFLVFLLIRRLWGDARAAWVGAALFLVHPVQVQTVAWVSQRSNLLAAAFSLTAVLLAMKSGFRPNRHGAAALVFYALGLFSKETAIVTAGLVFALDVFTSARRPSAAFYAAWAAVAAAYLIVRSQFMPLSQYGGGFSWGDVMLGLTAFPYYWGKLIAPIDLRASYAYPALDAWKVGGGLMLLVASGAAALATRRRAPGLSLGILWILASWLPYSQLAPLRAFFAERFLYVAAAGLALSVGWLAGRRRWTYPAGAAVLVLAALSVSAVRPWKSEGDLWAHAVRQEPDNPFALACLAQTLADPAEAAALYKRALVLSSSPDLRLALKIKLSRSELAAGRPNAAIYWGEAALRVAPDHPAARYNVEQARRTLVSYSPAGSK